MKFKGYKYKFTLSHFDLALFIEPFEDAIVLYDELEQPVDTFLKYYQEQKLEGALAEQQADELFGELQVFLKTYHFNLIKLEISHTPSRAYIINPYERRLDEDNLKYLRIKNMIDVTTDELMDLALNKPIQVSVDELEKPIEEEVVIQRETSPKQEIKVKPIKDKLSKCESSKYQAFKIVIVVIFLLIASYLLVIYIAAKEGLPWGADIYGHLFKADLVYQNLQKGNIYPLFTTYWYNGVQPFRYWGPVPYYIFCICQFVAKGGVLEAYKLFIGLSFFVGGIGWLLWGIKQNRMTLSFFIAVLWFFMPDNARVFFSEGNIPRIVIAMLLPYLFFFVWEFVQHAKLSLGVGISLLMILVILSHLMIAAMLGIATFIFLGINFWIDKKIEPPVQVLGIMLLSFVVCGFWIYPALQGGLVAMDREATSDVMRSLSMPFTISLNPFLRLESTGYFYYGLSIVIVSILGVFLSYKKSLAGFITTLIIFLGTTTAFVPLLSKLPLNQLLWMMRFTPMAYAFFLLALFNWTGCRRWILIGMLFLIAIDSTLSFNLEAYSAEKPTKITSILNTVKDITKQRLLLLDHSLFGSYPSYYLGSVGKKVAYSYGWAWQGAATAQNIVLLNTALERGYYTYLFDRAIEMGCDTIVIRKDSLKKEKAKWQDLEEAAKLSNYYLYEETPESYIIYRNLVVPFGVVTQYEGLCIGRSATDIPMQYPYFEIGEFLNIEQYTLERLSKYKLIYLSDFVYNTRQKAEEMIIHLSQRGVKIIIDMNRIPVDQVSNRMTFLGVDAQPITFHTKLPELLFNQKIYQAQAFKESYENWNTVYLDDVKQSIGFSWFGDKKLTFIGKGAQENVIFLGFNLMFHGMYNEDSKVKELLNNVLGIAESDLPKRQIVSLDVKVDANTISIHALQDNVNTTLAFLDAYDSTRELGKQHNLLTVQNGTTFIKIVYPYLLEGGIISLIGVIGLSALLIIINKKQVRE